MEAEPDPENASTARTCDKRISHSKHSSTTPRMQLGAIFNLPGS